MKFYEFNRHNSGGITHGDQLLSQLVIEAESADMAIEIARNAGVDFGFWNEKECEPEDQVCPRAVKLRLSGYSLAAAEKITTEYSANIVTTNTQKGEFAYVVAFQDLRAYCQYMSDTYGWTTPSCKILYANNEIEDICKNTHSAINNRISKCKPFFTL